MTGVMTGASPAATADTTRALARDRELLAQRRKQAELRLSRERARNSRRAVVGVVALAIVLGIGIHNGWVPTGLTAPPAAVDPDSKQFTETHTGQIRFSAVDGDDCHEVQFNNDTGRFGDGKTVRCGAGDITAASGAPAPGASARALSIRNAFNKR